MRVPHRPRQYLVKAGNQYERDIRRLVKSGTDLSKLEEVIDLLARSGTLPERCRDHALKGRLAGVRECHIAPDWLLLYARDDKQLILLLIRTGTHRDVLGVE